MTKILIRSGTLVDGNGSAPYTADLLIEGDLISKIGPEACLNRSGSVIDASGLIITPGFIDMHSHSDLTLFTQGGAGSALHQGVTTEVIGNCGFSCYPVHPERREMLESYLVGIGFERSKPLPWKDFEGYAAHLEKRGVGANVVSLTGHGSVRIAVMGFDARNASGRELEKMGALLQSSLDQGAFGMSSGLVYPPGINSPDGELEELCKVVARADGFYATHLRGDGLRDGPSLVTSLEDALNIARKTGVSLQVSHVAPKFPNDGTAHTVVEKMDRAVRSGLRVGCDMHPYMAAMTFLVSLMPPWFFEGGTDETVRRLSDSGERLKLKKALKDQFGHLGWEAFWSRNQPVLQNSFEIFRGRRFDEISRMTGKDADEVLLDMLRAEGDDLFRAAVLMWIYSPEDTLKTFSWAHTMLGADGVSTSPDAEKELMSMHPRSWGTFPTALRQYAGDGGHLLLEEVVRRMTSLAAFKIGLGNRGILAEGMKADIAIFDPKKFIHNGTYDDARQYAQGMEWVFVNGVAAIKDGMLTEKRAGRVLRRRQGG